MPLSAFKCACKQHLFEHHVHKKSPAPIRLMDQNPPRELRGACCFISDLHLTVDMPRTLSRFETFCQEIAPHYKSLIILGDLFEYWVGDDTADANPAAMRVISALIKLKQRGLFIGFIAGNRDFLLREQFARRAGMVLLPDPCTLKINGQTVLLTHGDQLCTKDTGYQAYRRTVQIRFVQKLFLMAPLALRSALARRMRKKSQQREYNAEAHARRLIKQDVPPQSAAQWFDQHHVRYMIHGHTHQPSTHLTFDTTRIVLPDWDCEDEKKTRWGYVDWSDQAEPRLIVHSK